MTKKILFSRFSSENFSFKKTIAMLLVFVLILSQTFQFHFFGTAQAHSDQYRDIISIVVDNETHRALRSEIARYAEDIQRHLGSTRTMISVIDEKTTPAHIAAQNEKLYYEGEDSDGVKTRLVGTVLIGNVPIPMVNSEGKYFPSIFPYVDFENKNFLYNEKSGRYEKVSALRGGDQSVEIWHGVINPSVGRDWNAREDIGKIKNFLDKTHDFYTQSGKFAVQTEAPRVFYFDGFAETKSIELRRVFQYGLWIANAENLAYARFTKYVLKDINEKLKDYDLKNDAGYADLIASLGIDGLDASKISSNVLSDDLIAQTPDIQTSTIIENFLSSFDKIFNKKVLGEELAAVHNAGRYNSGANVRADLGSVQISLMDDVAKDTLKKANDALESSFDDFLKENSVARRIPILDSMTAHYGEGTNLPFANYFFGTEGKNIQNAAQCTIARGNSGQKTEFGKSVLVEANSAFNVNSTEAHINALKGDEEYCYGGGRPHLNTFWGGNSLLRVANDSGAYAGGKNPLTTFPAKNFTGFTRSIFSLEGMLESDRISVPSLTQCIDYSYQYTLKQPHRWIDEKNRWHPYPTDTSGDRFRCRSQMEGVDQNQLVSSLAQFSSGPTSIPSGSTRSGNLFGTRTNSGPTNIPLRPDANIMNEIARYNGSTGCLVGSVSIDGQTYSNNRECIQRVHRSTGWRNSDSADDILVNYTNYRTLKYHTIDGVLRHISPTQEEISAADKNGVTPNLPIDINRSIEFLTKKGNIARLQYPNFFRMQATTVDEVRSWLRDDANKQWTTIFEKENSTTQPDNEAAIAENVLKAKNLPNKFDWNDYISDELIIQILQAKNWLHPDINKKYQDTIEGMLSYSGIPANGNILQKIPQISANSEKMYEIAYLGLSPVIPGNNSISNENVNNISADYRQKLAAIQGFNISQQENFQDSSTSNSAQCASPDGVSLFQWPAAIQCWIRSQLPPKILAGQCGGNTIGLDHSQNKNSQNLANTSSADDQKKSVTGARVIPYFYRTHIAHLDALDFSVLLQTDSENIIPPNGSVAKLQILSVTSAGKTIDTAQYDSYFSVANYEVPANTLHPKFLINARDKDFSLKAKIVYSVAFADGSRQEISSEDFTITASSTFLDSHLSSENASGLAVISADSQEKFFLNAIRKKSSSDTGNPEKNFRVTFLDDNSTQREIITLEKQDEKVEIPDAIIKNPGTYRAILSGEDGVAGELTFNVVSGKFSQISLAPVSTMIVKDSTTLVTLSLQDQLGNAVTPDLYSVELSVENGTILNAAGDAVKKLSLDIFDSRLSFAVRGDNVGKMKILANVKNHSAFGNTELKAEKEIDVLAEARVKLQFDNPNNALRAGGDAVKARVRIEDADGNQLSGFSSVISLSLPNGAGKFSSDIFDIKNGQSEIFTYMPGTVAGVHNLTINIPGIGILNNNPLTLIAGDAMYIDHTTVGGKIIFRTRDRYGNLANYSGQAFIAKNAETPVEIQFENGEYIIPEQSGYYIVEIPEIEKNKIQYQENGQTFEILPITKYAVQIFTNDAKYNFADDYNARYTVLAGGSFLREGEDILYNADPKKSQSLAVTTLLASTISDETILSVFPGGGYSLGRVDDAVFETSLNIERGFPVLHVFDSVRKSEIAKILYQTEKSELLACKNSDSCDIPKDRASIAGKMLLSETDGYNVAAQGGKIIFSKNNQALATIAQNGSIEAQSSISFRPKNYDTTNGFAFEILENGALIAEATYHFSQNESVILADDIFSDVAHNAPVLQSAGYQLRAFSDQALNNAARGFMVQRSLSDALFDDAKVGPRDIDDIGTLSENPGVGWMGNNRMLLSFAAGDSVGEATKWFHTYMMLNMGDPIASVRHGEPDTQVDGLDRSIGTQIADSRRSQIQNFFEKDMNGDGLNDVIVQYEDAYIQLLLNIGGRFRSLGNIAFLPKNRNSLIEIGDFRGDKFSDIIVLDSDGKISLINNNDSKFSPQNISLSSGNAAPSHIQQMKVYDMDADGKDDLVYLTSGGELGILYGTDTAGAFEQKILDSTLGITLRNETDNHDGAVISDAVTQFDTFVGRVPANAKPADAGITDEKIREQVYYQEQSASIQSIPNSTINPKVLAQLSAQFGNSALSDDLQVASADNTTRTTPIPLKTYIRSQYASLYGLEISKKFQSQNAILYPYDTIQVEVSVKNLSSESQKNVKYLDSIPKIFDRDTSATYSVEITGNRVEKNFQEKDNGEFDLEFDVGEIPAGAEAKIRYTLKVLPASYGEMLVGDFEEGTVGHDNFGDVAFKTSTTCGAEMMTWLSIAAREYQSSRRPALYSAPLPKGLSEKLTDSDKNGLPDSVEKMTPAEGKKQFDAIAGNSKNPKNLVTVEKNGKNSVKIGFDAETTKNIENKAQEIANGLSCGFGGGSCMSFPINWAPLAPGNDPVVFGYPVGDGFKVNEGLPVLSALTAINVPNPSGCYQVPTVWPASPLRYVGSCTAETGAGWYLGVDSPTNFMRLFVTPTLTLGMGVGMCFGGPASTIGGNPGKGLSPLIQGGNCIVMAKPMPVCKGDGSTDDGDVSAISGLGTISKTWNGASCNLEASAKTQLRTEEKNLEKEILEYMKSPSTRQAEIVGITAKISRRNVSSLNGGPLVNIGNASSGASSIELSVTGGDKIADIKKVVNVKNKRISAFPDFIMDWLTRQTEELTTSLFTPPNLTIIPPTDFGQNAKVDSSYSDFLDKLSKAYSSESLSSLKAEMSSAYRSTDTVSALTRASGGGNSSAGQWYGNQLNKATSSVTPLMNSAQWSLNALRAAYTFLGKLPFLNIREQKININVPWIRPSELDQYERQLTAYEKEFSRALKNWCVTGESKECLLAKAKLENSGFLSSIQANIKRIQEYKKFPEKLQKYVNWKEKLMYDLLCNIQAVEKMTFGWVKDNGIRFQKWAELYVLIKAIAQSWQPLLDIFAETSAQCGVCRNERNNSQQWKFKLISMIIPKIPVISFPKWPDIVLDLSDVRLGIDLSVPDFNFRLSPMRLPALPGLSLPNSPTASLTLPSLPVLPALPSLPDLPELPSLPMVKLPDLPPPPKLPKLGGSISAALNILKLISKLYCYYQKTVLIPEWQVGDVIAQRTERQSTLPMDFLNIQFPQFSVPELKEIRISTHLNYTLRTDFITEFAKAAVKPINQFTSDLGNSIPSKILDDVNIRLPIDNHINVNQLIDGENRINNALQNIQNISNDVGNTLQNTSNSIENSAQDAVDNLTSYAKFASGITLETAENLLEPIIRKFEAEKDIFLDNESFAKYLKSELLASGFVAQAADLDKKMYAAQTEAKKLQAEIEAYNREKFDLLYEFVHEHERKNGELQNIVDLLRNDDSSLLANAPYIGQFASNESEKSSLALAQLANLESRAIESISDNSTTETTTAYDIGKSIERRIHRLAQLNTSNNSQNIPEHTINTGGIAANYLPKFEGMYILTENSKTQTKLFDYVELIGKNDRVDTKDIDNDGDRDYIFVLGGNLYVKNTHLKEPAKIVDTTTRTENISQKLPEVPNNFVQVLSTPSELNVSFRNTVPDEREWRLEFLEKYTEWDRVAIDKNLEKSLPKTVVDLFVQNNFGDFDNNGMRSMSVNRYISGGEKASKFVLESSKIEKFTGDIFLSISPHRTIYTGNKNVEILYRSGENSEEKRMTLEAHRAYQFSTTTEIRAFGGSIFVIGGGAGTYRYGAEDELIGLPILPGMRLTSEESFSIFDATHRENISLSPNSVYIVKNLGMFSESYNFAIPYPNGFYYARLKHLSRNQQDRAGVTLLSPQLASDSTNPVISLSDTIRVPVYAQTKIQISEIVTELSDFEVAIDEDLTVDADNNGVYDDDFETNRKNVTISDQELIFGPFDTPENRQMMLRVRDEFGNTTYMPISVEVFTPIPMLENVSESGNVSGILDNPIENEPIEIFRIRSSEYPMMVNTGSILTDTEGKFSSGSYRTPENITVTTGQDTFKILHSGIFENLPAGYEIRVSPADTSKPMSIDVYNVQKILTYQQFFSLPNSARIAQKTDENVSLTGNLLVSTQSQYRFANADYNDPKIPWGAYITDAQYNAILAIARDGNIYTIDTNISLNISEKDGFMMISAKKGETPIADFHYKMNFFYTTK